MLTHRVKGLRELSIFPYVSFSLPFFLTDILFLVIISPAMPVANEQQISLFSIRYTDIITIVLHFPASGNV